MEYTTLGKLHSKMTDNLMHDCTKIVVCPVCNSHISFNMKDYMEGYTVCKTCSDNEDTEEVNIDIPSDDGITYITNKGLKGKRIEDK